MARASGTGGTTGQSYRPAPALLASLFFMWGFLGVINGTLPPHPRTVFMLSYSETGPIKSVWFVGYPLAWLPAARLIERIGYKRALTTGLGIMTLASASYLPQVSRRTARRR